MGLTKKFFPQGCPVCGHEVKLETEVFKYICYNCNAHADCHRSDTEYANKYEPTESMVSNETHFLRSLIRTDFSILFRERRYVHSNDGMIETALINIIYPLHLVKETIGNKEKFYKVVNKEKDILTVISMDKGEVSTLESHKVSRASNRDKSMIYLAEKLGADLVKINIGFFNESMLKKASEVIHEGIQEARSKSLANY